MKTKLICINPFTKEPEKYCNRYFDNRCCMCPGPKVVTDLKEIENLIQVLKTDGINSKQKAIKLLEEMKIVDDHD